MRRYFLVSLVVLAGCQSMPTYYKAGSTPQQTQADYDACKIASFRSIPQTTATRMVGGYYNPGTVQCNTVGTLTSCQTVGAVNIPPTAQSYDVNGGLRDRYIQQCLARNGYSTAVLPRCTSGAQIAESNELKSAGKAPLCYDSEIQS